MQWNAHNAGPYENEWDRRPITGWWKPSNTTPNYMWATDRSTCSHQSSRNDALIYRLLFTFCCSLVYSKWWALAILFSNWDTYHCFRIENRCVGLFIWKINVSTTGPIEKINKINTLQMYSTAASMFICENRAKKLKFSIPFSSISSYILWCWFEL